MSFNFEFNITELLAISASLLALFIAIKNRRNTLRENIFNRQLDLFTEIEKVIVKLEDEIDDWIEAKEEGDEETIDEKLDKANELYVDLDTIIANNAFIIPEKLDEVIHDYLMYLNDIIAKNEDPGYIIDVDELSDKSFDFEHSVRKFIGLKKLSRENRRLVKSLFSFI